MTRGSVVFLDTNVLLSATAAKRHDHSLARGLFRVSHDAGSHLALSGQVLREYLVVATRPVEVNGLGMEQTQALRNVEWFLAQTVFLEETKTVFDRLMSLARESNAVGKHLHDTNVAAVMRVHGIRVIVTANADDYSAWSEVTPVSVDEAHELFAAVT